MTMEWLWQSDWFVKNDGDMVHVHVSRLMKVLPTIQNESEESMPEMKNTTNGETVEKMKLT